MAGAISITFKATEYYSDNSTLTIENWVCTIKLKDPLDVKHLNSINSFNYWWKMWMKRRNRLKMCKEVQSHLALLDADAKKKYLSKFS